jgi:hypothetical protein
MGQRKLERQRTMLDYLELGDASPFAQDSPDEAATGEKQSATNKKRGLQ